MAKSINNKQVIKKLNDWTKALDRKISIRIGIIGQQAHEKPEGSDLTYAELGAIQEFGAETDTKIPTRSFLREPILSEEGKEELKKAVENGFGKEFDVTELNEYTADKILDNAAYLMAETAYSGIQNAAGRINISYDIQEEKF